MENNLTSVGQLAIEIFKFDHTYYYSDDHRVWKNGEERRKELASKAKSMNLSIGDKILMITIFQKLWDENSYWVGDGNFASINEKHIQWPYKASMYGIAGITDKDLLFSPIQ